LNGEELEFVALLARFTEFDGCHFVYVAELRFN